MPYAYFVPPLHHVSCQIDIWMHAFTFHTFIDCSYQAKVGRSVAQLGPTGFPTTPLTLSLSPSFSHSLVLWVGAGLATQEGGHGSESGVGGEARLLLLLLWAPLAHRAELETHFLPFWCPGELSRGVHQQPGGVRGTAGRRGEDEEHRVSCKRRDGGRC